MLGQCFVTFGIHFFNWMTLTIKRCSLDFNATDIELSILKWKQSQAKLLWRKRTVFSFCHVLTLLSIKFICCYAFNRQLNSNLGLNLWPPFPTSFSISYTCLFPRNQAFHRTPTEVHVGWTLDTPILIKQNTLVTVW